MNENNLCDEEQKLLKRLAESRDKEEQAAIKRTSGRISGEMKSLEK